MAPGERPGAAARGSATDGAAARKTPAGGSGLQSSQRFAWYVGLALMAALEVIDWPVAIVIGVGHEIGHRARPRAVRELAGGIEAAG